MTRQNEIAGLPFDGIICIGGEDWWYHNRGHFDFQIMRRLARACPVLFVNSLAVRMPSVAEPGQFMTRVGRKLKSLSRGLVHVENDFWVVSPVSIPGPTGQTLSNWALAPQIKRAAARIGIRKPLLWVHCPAGQGVVDDIPHTALVLQRTDRFEAFPEADPLVVAAQIAALKRTADLVVYCNPALLAQEQHEVRSQLLITHGVDLETFKAAGENHHADPVELRGTPHPRVGFIGGVDAHTFGTELFVETARRLPDVQFVLVGGCSLPDGWCRLPNVHLIGRRPYESIASYMAAMDVLIMPWNNSAWIEACNPIKLKEYFAVGRPVVTTDFPALAAYRELVRVAATPDQFADAIRAAINAPFDAHVARACIASETWAAKALEVHAALQGLALDTNSQRRPIATAA